jgi:small neutral amino acid transporter SnatA (MarC family)
VFEINTFGAQKFAYLFERCFLAINPVGALACTIDCTGYFELGSRDNFIIVRLIFVIVNILEVDANSGMSAILMLG